MDDLVISGTVALAIVYAGLVLVLYGIFRVLSLFVQVFLAKNYLFFGALVIGIFVAFLAYVAAGLWLRKRGTT
jgi:hypothetical protein